MTSDQQEPPQSILRSFLTAVAFLTRIPVPSWVGHEPVWLGRSTVYFPLVGGMIGASAAMVFLAALTLWHPLTSAALSFAFTVYITGSFHEDGLADCFDGFGGGWSREDIIKIMRDSRVGTFASIGLVLFGSLKISTTASLNPETAVVAIICSQILGRWSSVPLLWFYPYIDEDLKMANLFKKSVNGKRAIASTLVAFAGLAVLGLTETDWIVKAKIVVCVIVSVIMLIIGGRYVYGKLGGMAGDCLGALNQFVELAVLLIFASGTQEPSIYEFPSMKSRF